VACGESYDLLQVVDGINKILGTDIQPVFEPARAGDVRESLADISLARKLLKYEPIVDFDEGLRRTVEYYRSTHKKN
jgi:UDP-glucose 4-epimerase